MIILTINTALSLLGKHLTMINVIFKNQSWLQILVGLFPQLGYLKLVCIFK